MEHLRWASHWLGQEEQVCDTAPWWGSRGRALLLGHGGGGRALPGIQGAGVAAVGLVGQLPVGKQDFLCVMRPCNGEEKENKDMRINVSINLQ